MRVPFGDLKRHYERIKPEIDASIQGVMQRGWFILGKEVEEFEHEFANYCGTKNAVGIGSGTEAIHLALMACGLEYGDEVITAPNTCIPTISGITAAGGKPVYIDIEPDNYTIDPERIESVITEKTKVILPVHLYGRASSMEAICNIAEDHNLIIIEDAAQAHGSEFNGKKLGTFGKAGCFSFYPSKNLGAFGDGGMVITDDDDLAKRLRMIRNYGQEKRNYNVIVGYNSRLDEIQAAILRVKLKYLNDWNKRRREIRQIYINSIENPVVSISPECRYGLDNCHICVARTKERDRFRSFLAAKGVETEIHYPIPAHLQKSYQNLGYGKQDFPITELVCSEVLSLPVFPELEPSEIEHVISCIKQFR